MKRRISRAQAAEFEALITAARSCIAVAELLTDRACDLVGEEEVNGRTFDAVWNRIPADAKQVLKTLGIKVSR